MNSSQRWTITSQYAGSISINRLVDTTKAMVDGANLVAAGNVRQDARNEAQAIAIGVAAELMTMKTAKARTEKERAG